jgi:hypothetical protein
MNRVTNAEFRAIDSAMRKQYDKALKELKQIALEQASDWQKRVDAWAKEYYSKKVRPQIDRALADAARGADPLGFKFNPRIPQPREHQVRAFIVGQGLNKLLTHQAVDDYIRSKGEDPEAGDRDNQASYWAVNDIKDEAYNEYGLR